MKKVRFETPTKPFQYEAMNDFECQSPRPFMEKKIMPAVPDIKYGFSKVLQFSSDPLQKYECGNGSPYPMVNKTQLPKPSIIESKWSSSNDLELSLLDSCKQVPKRTGSGQESNVCMQHTKFANNVENNLYCYNDKANSRVLSSLENKYTEPPNVLSKHNDFFLCRGNLQKNQIDNEFKKTCIDKENNPLAAKSKLMKVGISNPFSTPNDNTETPFDPVAVGEYCKCHHCVMTIDNNSPCLKFKLGVGVVNPSASKTTPSYVNHPCLSQHISNICSHCNCNVPACSKIYRTCLCNTEEHMSNYKNSVDKKSWALEKYEQAKNVDTMDVEKHGNVKEKREPTVADLFKIIKLQNEQLQLLQDKVDKFISTSKFEKQKHSLPPQNYVTEHVAVETIDKEHHKISIGVMTSFEMVRTSTIINKEIVKQSSEAQIQCNSSEISVKEVVQPVHLNFLDGITPAVQCNTEKASNATVGENNDMTNAAESWQKDNANEEKTYNELSLYNVQVENATTPLMSPEQSMYLDVRDYSDSESESEDQSNVGWTYYNKVMTHVNGILHDSDMPSSASALYRNTRQKCMQMKFDQRNVSVIKRVKFGDDPVGIPQQHIANSTDTSLKMNQLAAKYLKSGSLLAHQTSPRPTAVAPIDMSIATRNYMEKHHLLQGLPMKSIPATAVEIPRFLDITALKQQPKLL